MNKRLVWNFEIDSNTSLQLPGANEIHQDLYRWESRFFWPEETIITLHGLDSQFLELSRYKVKHKEDTYFILPDAEYNLKIREEKLFYKPVREKSPQGIAYEKKIPLSELDSGTPVPGTPDLNAQTFITQIKQTGIKINVSKEVITYKLKTTPTCKLELARLVVAHQCFFSLSVESEAYVLVESICQQIIGAVQNCDYVSFLKGIIK